MWKFVVVIVIVIVASVAVGWVAGGGLTHRRAARANQTLDDALAVMRAELRDL